MLSKALQALEFTKTYRQYQDEPIAIKEAMCLKSQFPAVLQGIKEGDLLVGRIDRGLIGFSIDEWGQQAFGYYCLSDEIAALIQNNGLDEQVKEQLRQALDFWAKENTSAKLRKVYPAKMAKAIPSDNWMGSSGIAFPLYRLTGGNIDYSRLMRLGIPGLLQQVEEREERGKQAGESSEQLTFYTGLKLALQVFIDCCLYYAEHVERASNDAPPERQQQLRRLAKVLRKLTHSKPETFYEAVQLMWLYAIISDIRNHGRMDVYLGDFYVKDIEKGVLTEEEALQILQSLWKLMADRNTVVHNRVIIGGRGRENEENADKFAMLAIEASRTVKEPEPQLSLRFYQGMNPKLMEKALDTIGEGCTFPMLYNDDVNVQAVEKCLRVSNQEALQYVPYGCGEYIINHRSFGTPSGVINLLKALEVTLRNGKDPLTGRIAGLQLGQFQDFTTFDKLWEAYKKQVEYFVEIMAEQEVIEYEVAGKTAPFLYASLLYDSCLQRGKPLFAGGVEYLGGTLETYGNTNTADSLTAIKELVYESKQLTHEQLLEMLDKNFEGFEEERQAILDLPKYGNDHTEADLMAKEVHEHVCNYVNAQADRVGLHYYLVVVINNSANTLMGKWTSASADGRKSTEPMANGNNPAGGRDKEGLTAMLNSLVKLDPMIHAGAVQNMKFSSAMFKEHRKKLEAVLEVYFESGGAQAMITVVNRQDLERAMVEPEKYRHLMVRVGGFSARFVELSRDVQKEILSRTLY